MSPMQLLEGPCNMHVYVDAEVRRQSTHLIKNFHTFLGMQVVINNTAPRTLAIAAPLPPPGPAPSGQPQPAENRNQDKEYPRSRGAMSMIQKGRTSNRIQKLITRQINMAVTAPPPSPEFLHWSEKEITFSRADHSL